MGDVFLPEFMKSMKVSRMLVRIQILGANGAKWTSKAIEFISKMLCIDPDTRLKISDVYSEILNIQGLCSKVSCSSVESFIKSFHTFLLNLLKTSGIFTYFCHTIPYILQMINKNSEKYLAVMSGINK